jgi:propanol-preferring alcohol dehydrogenase
MKAMVLDRAGAPLREVTRDEVAPGEGEIAIDVVACAVCRTDLQICDGDLPARAMPIVPGHQIVGRVGAVGANVTGWRAGDRACVGWLASACGACPPCKLGRENLCEAARFTGWDRDGGYATRAIVRADFALHTPRGFDDVDAAPLLCGGVIGYRSLRRSGIAPGGKLGLYGFGASATIAIQIARHWGCRVFVCTRSKDEQARAKTLGAEWSGGYDDAPPAVLDAAVTFAPSGDVVVAALRALDRGGTVAINAIHLDRVPQFSYDLLWWERNVVSVANYTRDDARELLDLAAKIPLRTTYETHPLSDANIALARLRDGEVRGAAVLTP